MKNIKRNKIPGALIMFLGALCIIYPIITSLVVNIAMGCALIFAALMLLPNCIKCKDATDKILHILLASLYCFAGVLTIMQPVLGIALLTIILGVGFIIQGYFMLYYWTKIKADKDSATIALCNGVVTLTLGLLLIANYESGFWLIGMFVGINLMFTGINLLAFGPMQNSLGTRE